MSAGDFSKCYLLHFTKTKTERKNPKTNQKNSRALPSVHGSFFCEYFEYPHNNAAKTHSGKMPLIIIYSFSYWTFVLDYYRNSSFEHSCISVYVHVYLPATDNCRSSTFSSSKWSGHPLVWLYFPMTNVAEHFWDVWWLPIFFVGLVSIFQNKMYVSSS